jgi:hypothetical protein
MRLLLDECVPRPLKRDLIGHDVSRVVDMRWFAVGAHDAALHAEYRGRFTYDLSGRVRQNR